MWPKWIVSDLKLPFKKAIWNDKEIYNKLSIQVDLQIDVITKQHYKFQKNLIVNLAD